MKQLPCSARQMLLIERMAQQRFDHGLPADIQVSGGLIEFLKHGLSKVHVDALNWVHFPVRIGEKAGDVLGGWRTSQSTTTTGCPRSSF